MRFLWKNWPIIVIAIGILAIAGLIFAGKDSPTAAGNEFLIALAKGDVDTLMKDSYYPGPKEELRKQWEFATQEAGKYYRFIWRVKNERDSSDTTASVQLGWTKNYGAPGSYEDNTELPMVKEDGKWKVDVRALDHEIYPALPR